MTARTALAATVAATLMPAGCTSSTPDPAPEAPTAAAAAPARAAEPTPEPAPEPEPVTDVGATVPPDLVEASRDAGAAVYVSPNGDGTGIVIDPTITPAQLVADVEPIDGNAPSTMEGFSDQQGELVRVDDEAEAAGTGVFVLIGAPSYGPSGTLESFGYRIGMVGEVVGHSEDKPVNRIRPTKSAAIAAAQELIDLNPGYEIIDLTD